jgi:BlaI family transcriptional regulator, penicillinase repressor
MPHVPLSNAETEIARTLWNLGQGTVRQVADALPKDRGIDFATVQTYLRRLEKKGYVRSDLAGRTRIYQPLIKPKTVIREALNGLLDRLFGGEAFPLVRHLVEDKRINPEEVKELRKLLSEMEKKQK